MERGEWSIGKGREGREEWECTRPTSGGNLRLWSAQCRAAFVNTGSILLTMSSADASYSCEAVLVLHDFSTVLRLHHSVCVVCVCFSAIHCF